MSDVGSSRELVIRCTGLVKRYGDVVAVDGVLLRGWHSTSADAWSAGVAEVDRFGLMSPAVEPAPARAAGRLRRRTHLLKARVSTANIYWP